VNSERKKLLRRILLWGSAILAAVLALLWLLLPGISARILIRSAGLTGCEVRRVGLFQIDLAGLNAGDGENSLHVDSILLDYSIIRVLFFSPSVDRVAVSGLNLNVKVSPDSVETAGRVFKTGGGPRPKTEKPLSLPVKIRSLSIKNSSVKIFQGGKTYSLPLDFTLSSPSGDLSPADFSLKSSHKGQEINISGKIDLARNSVSAALRAATLSLTRVAGLFDIPGKPAVAGTAANFELLAEAQISPFKLKSALCSGKVSGLMVSGEGYRVSGVQNGAGDLKIASPDGVKWTAALPDIETLLPAGVVIPGFVCSAELSESGGVSFQGGCKPLLKRIADASGYTAAEFTAPMETELSLKGSADTGSGSWKADVSLMIPERKAPGEGVFQMTFKNGGLSLGKAEARLGVSGGKAGFQADVSCSAADITGAASGASLSISGVEARCSASGADFKSFQTKSSVTVSRPILAVSSLRSGVEKITVESSVPFPPPPGAALGSLKALEIYAGETRACDFSAEITKTAAGIAFTGAAAAHVLDRPVINLKGFAGGPADGDSFGLEFSLSRKSEGLFPLPSAPGVTAGGSYFAEGKISSSARGGLKSSLKAGLSDFTVSMPDKKLLVEGIDCGLLLTDLVSLKSAPRQVLSFKKASFGNIEINGGKTEFQVESASSVFAENSSVSWCGGSVTVSGMRISPGVSDYSLTLFCDRISLAKLMDQLGLAKAAGDGALNGKVPLRIRGGDIEVYDAFLYSTPGEGGRIEVSAGGSIAGSVAAGAGGNAELALAALSDFNYNWAKLALNSRDDILSMRLQLDGKPSGALPFKYDEETGQFVKCDIKLGGSVLLQGIKLDVNFSLPFNKIAGFSKNIKDAFGGRGK
jgi:hypothetical protein